MKLNSSNIGQFKTELTEIIAPVYNEALNDSGLYFATETKKSTTINIALLLQKIMELNHYLNEEIQYTKYGNLYKRELKKKTTNSVYTMGMNIIYGLRGILTGEEFYYNLNRTVQNNKLETILINQKDLFSNDYIKLDRGALKFKQNLFAIDKFKDEASKNQIVQQVNNHWDQISNWATVGSYHDSVNTNPIYIDNKKYYRKNKADVDVFVRYASYKRGNTKARLKFYRYGEQKLSYNLGWLHEWYSEFLFNHNYDPAITEANSKTPLKPIMKSIDTIEGTKGGDYSAVINNRNAQVQNKKDNDKIISLQLVRNTLLEIEQALILYQSNVNNISEVVKKFKNIFTTSETDLTPITTTIEQVIESSINKYFS